MATRNVAILNPAYSMALTATAIGPKYVSWRGSDNTWFYERHLKFGPKKRQALEMLLLFDKVRLFGADDDIDYSTLVASGFVTIDALVSDERFKYFSADDDATNGYAMYLKPFVLPYAAKRTLTTLEPYLSARGVRHRALVSQLYNIRFRHPADEHLIAQAISAVREWQQRDKTGAEGQDESVKGHPTPIPEFVLELHLRRVGNFVGHLMSYLDLSNDQHAAVVQDEFDFANADSEPSEMTDRTQYQKAYRVLSLQMRDLVGPLPAVNSLDEVFRIKEKRTKELRALREIVADVEQSLREGREHAAARAAAAISVAAKDLRRGLQLGDVSRWCTYASLPVGIIESFCGIPPVAGLTTAVVGVGQQLPLRSQGKPATLPWEA